jgi:hypothetical protein
MADVTFLPASPAQSAEVQLSTPAMERGREAARVYRGAKADAMAVPLEGQGTPLDVAPVPAWARAEAPAAPGAENTVFDRAPGDVTFAPGAQPLTVLHAPGVEIFRTASQAGEEPPPTPDAWPPAGTRLVEPPTVEEGAAWPPDRSR